MRWMVMLLAVGLVLGCEQRGGSVQVGSEDPFQFILPPPCETCEPYPALLPVSEGWENLLPLPTPRNELAASVVGGIIYAIGGYDFNASAAVEAYDPATGEWTDGAPMPTARNGLTSSVVDGMVYAIGGSDDNGRSVGTVEAYDPETGEWVSLAPMPTPRQSLASAVVDGIIYAIGGFGENGGPNGGRDVVEAYDPATDSWSARAPLPTPRTLLAAVAVDGLIYVIGGFAPQFEDAAAVVDVAEVYDPASDSWSAAGSMPTARSALAAAAVNGVIYVVGGWIPAGNLTATVEAYDPATDGWTAVSPMPTARSALAAAGVAGTLYTFGGHDDFAGAVEAHTP